MLKIQVLNDIMLSMSKTPKDKIFSNTSVRTSNLLKKYANQNPLLPPKSMVYEPKIPYYMPHQVPDQIAEGPALKSDNVLCTVHIMGNCSSANSSQQIYMKSPRIASEALAARPSYLYCDNTVIESRLLRS